MKLKSLDGIYLTPLLLNNKIGVNYDVMSLNITAKDLFYLLSEPPYIFLEEGKDGNLIQKNYNIQNIKLDMIQQLINRILLYYDDSYTYQDTVYITSLLKKLGMKNVNGYLSNLVNMIEDNVNIVKLIEFYKKNGDIIKFFAKDIRIEQSQNELYDNKDNTRYYMHQGIYKRLDTTVIYHEVFEQTKQYESISQSINPFEFRMAQQLKVTNALILSELKKEYLLQHNGVLEAYINPYEQYITSNIEISKEDIESNLVSAFMFSLVDNLFQIRSHQMEQKKSANYNLSQAFYHSVDNTLNRYRLNYANTDNVEVKENKYINNIYKIHSYEIELLDQFTNEYRNEIFKINESPIQNWEQELIYYIEKNNENFLSEDNINNIVEAAKKSLTFEEKIQFIDKYLYKDTVNQNMILVYQDIINEIKESTKENITEEKREILNDLFIEIIDKKSTISSKEISKESMVQCKSLIYEIVNTSDFNNYYKKICFLGDQDIYNPILYNQFNNSIYENIRKKLNLSEQSISQMTQYIHNKDLIKSENINTVIKSFTNVLDLENNNVFDTYSEDSSFSNVKNDQFITKEEDVSYNITINENSDKNYQEVVQQLNQINQKNIEINNQYDQQAKAEKPPDQTMVPDTKRIINETLNVIHKESHDKLIEYEENVNTVTQVPVIDEKIKKLASEKTIQILETILKNEDIDKEDPSESKLIHKISEIDLISEINSIETQIEKQKESEHLLNQTSKETIQTLETILNKEVVKEKSNESELIHKVSNIDLISEFNPIKTQIERHEYKHLLNQTTKDTIHLLETILKNEKTDSTLEFNYLTTQEEKAKDSKQLLSQSKKTIFEPKENEIEKWNKEKFKTDYGIDKSRKSLFFVHKEQENTVDDNIIELLNQTKQMTYKQENAINEKNTTQTIHTSQIDQTKTNITHQSMDEISEIVQSSLQQKMEMITDRVFSKLEKRLQSERRRRGY